MPRPRKYKEIQITGDITIPASKFKAGFTGVIDKQGQIRVIGKEFADCEFEVYVKKHKGKESE